MVIAQASIDDRCPVCKSDKYLNPNLKFLVNPECYHKMLVPCQASRLMVGVRRVLIGYSRWGLRRVRSVGECCGRQSSGNRLLRIPLWSEKSMFDGGLLNCTFHSHLSE